MELLILLIEKEGHLVTREEIVDRLWGKDVFLDTEHGINTAIRKIRNALRDDPEAPRFLQTVTGRGYRFIARTNLISQEPGNANCNGALLLQVQSNIELSRASRKANDAEFTHPKITKDKLAWIGIVGCLLVAWFAFSAERHFFGDSNRRTGVIRSIAVLPVENLSGDATQDYLADGMTEQLITELGQVKALRVISHTSVNQYKGTKKPVPVIARELQVDDVVEGTVTRSQGRVRVTANLVQATPSSGWTKPTATGAVY